MQNIFLKQNLSSELKTIAQKVFTGNRITTEEGLFLYQHAEIGYVSVLANFIRKAKNGDIVFFNKNIHIEPTNICVNNCHFCSYSRKKNEPGFWEFSIDEIIEIISAHRDKKITEVHIVGGVHPDRDIHFYCELLQKIKQLYPEIFIKAFTAVELDYMINKAGFSLSQGLALLKQSGLDAIPGGGAEIFDTTIRKQLCHEKSTAAMWLAVHEEAHKQGIPTNATMLYGHVENYSHRIDHLNQLRNLQDKTKMFQAFIPLKFRNKNNKLSYLKEVSIVEDMRNYAISRIFLDNFVHIKAYWPMIGKEATQLALSFGVDDIDGTIEDTTKIYSMAGAEEQKPSLSTNEIIELIQSVNLKPIERDTLYNHIHEF